MKRLFAILAAAALLLAGASTGNAASKKVQKEEVVFVTSMDCHKCAEKVRENIAFEKGVLDLEVKLEDKTVRVVYNSAKTDPGKLAKAINKLGYTAEVKK